MASRATRFVVSLPSELATRDDGKRNWRGYFATPGKLAASFCGSRPGADRVVPFGMELVACDVEGFHLGVGDFDALLVGARIERALDAQAGLGRRCRDQFDDGQRR